jgi:hypothetical protein
MAELSADELAAQLLGDVAEPEPLTAEEIEARVFAICKEGPDGPSKVTLEELVGFLAGDATLVVRRDEKKWNPLIWASFNGHVPVRRCCTAMRRRRQPCGDGSYVAVRACAAARCCGAAVVASCVSVCVCVSVRRCRSSARCWTLTAASVTTSW